MKNNWILIILFFLTISCQNNVVFEQTKDINNKGWHQDSIVRLSFKPQHVPQTYNLFFLIRNDQKYPYANLFLIAKMTQGQHQIIDTLEYAMADQKGHWLGSGIWDLKESKLVYKKKYNFKDTIPVHISIQQADRKSGNVSGDEILPGIKTVGIIIESTHK